MIAKTFTLLLLLGASLGLDLNSVDVNTLSCDPEGQVFLLLPHFDDCSKFYMCTHGREVEFTCAPGTVFDFPLQTCNHAWATKCWLREVEGHVEEGSNEEGSIEEASIEEGSGEESGDFEWSISEDLPEVAPDASLAPVTGKLRSPRSQFAAKLDCSNAHEAALLIPFQGDCQRFWRCVNGLPVSAFCSDGLFFNERTMQCDFEANVRCAVNHEEELNGEYMIFE